MRRPMQNMEAELNMISDITSAFNRKTVDIPVIAVTGGKGGTGKTTVAVNLAAALGMKGYRVLLVDADVDSPTAAVALGVRLQLLQQVESFVPTIIEAECGTCGKCADVCRAHALIQIADRKPIFFDELCSGCEACRLVCPFRAIERGSKVIGFVHGAVRDSVSYIGGELKPNETRSAQVVAATKTAAFSYAGRDSCDVMIVDTAPGTHCNVVQSLRAADVALAVTEPTLLGTYDLGLILKLASMLGIPCKVVLNRADMPGHNKDSVVQVARSSESEVIIDIPMDRALFKSYTAGEPLVTVHPDSPAARSIMKLTELLIQQLMR
jgi:MinD superfamily P-loop ATPase